MSTPGKFGMAVAVNAVACIILSFATVTFVDSLTRRWLDLVIIAAASTVHLFWVRDLRVGEKITLFGVSVIINFGILFVIVVSYLGESL